MVTSMKVQSTNKAIANGVVSMQLLSNKQIESVTTLIKHFNNEEIKTYFEAAMSLSKLDTFDTSKDIFLKL